MFSKLSERGLFKTILLDGVYIPRLAPYGHYVYLSIADKKKDKCAN